jgi:hypothetical protein
MLIEQFGVFVSPLRLATLAAIIVLEFIVIFRFKIIVSA